MAIEQRSGIKTTEFWLSLIAVIVGALLSSGMFKETTITTQVLGIASTVLGALGYVATRSGVKKAIINTPFSAKIEGGNSKIEKGDNNA